MLSAIGRALFLMVQLSHPKGTVTQASGTRCLSQQSLKIQGEEPLLVIYYLFVFSVVSWSRILQMNLKRLHSGLEGVFCSNECNEVHPKFPLLGSRAHLLLEFSPRSVLKQPEAGTARGAFGTSGCAGYLPFQVWPTKKLQEVKQRQVLNQGFVRLVLMHFQYFDVPCCRGRRGCRSRAGLALSTGTTPGA